MKCYERDRERYESVEDKSKSHTAKQTQKCAKEEEKKKRGAKPAQLVERKYLIWDGLVHKLWNVKALIINVALMMI